MKEMIKLLLRLIVQSGKNRLKYLAFSARFHFFTPAFLYVAMAYGSINKPAKISTVEFPRRAGFPGFHVAFIYNPTGLLLSVSISLHSKKKEHLPLYMNRNISPSLLEALYGFTRGTEQFCHLALRFS